MPRLRLTPDVVLESAAAIVDRAGWHALTLAAVAADLEVRIPSLYNHVDGLDALRRALSLRAVTALRDALQTAAAGRARADALRASALAYRAWAREHPGLYAATQVAPAPDDPEHIAAAGQVVAVLIAVLRGYDLSGDSAVHTIRALRSSLHGFLSLELNGGFGLPLDIDASYLHLIAVLEAGIEASARA